MNYKYSIALKGKLHKFTHTDKFALADIVSQFLKDNAVKISKEDLLKAIDRQSKIKDPIKKLSFKDAVRGANALIKYASGYSVSQKEIERRSYICDECPLKSEVEKCGPCGTAGKIARFVGELKVRLKLSQPIPEEIKYSYCDVCDCSLALMVVTRKEDFHTESLSVNSKRPDNCWLKVTSTNYTNE